MKPMDISINRLAREIAVSPGRIGAIVDGTRALTANTALRLGESFGFRPSFGSDFRPILIPGSLNAWSAHRSISESRLAWRDGRLA